MAHDWTGNGKWLATIQPLVVQNWSMNHKSLLYTTVFGYLHFIIYGVISRSICSNQKGKLQYIIIKEAFFISISIMPESSYQCATYILYKTHTSKVLILHKQDKEVRLQSHTYTMLV